MNEYIYCGFWRRSIAVVLDRIFLITFLLICIIMILLSNLPLADTLSDSFISTSIILSLTILYDPIFESSSMQATLGCYILGMKIINEDGTRISFLKSLIRFIILALISSTVILGIISIICMICTNEKKFLHDMICGTRMVKR
ncbi:RDD family protein [Candidatus Tisiphia endosymbiont of Metellina segmentata]|uniref:RDD family protein n=1 Tax=Candidatus Tisiphia endosymbiont of Metellina segmentata TaxID=3066274 RepID=UPI0039775DEE|nr:RDD family protein [Rickettsiaceae bacterium]